MMDISDIKDALPDYLKSNYSERIKKQTAGTITMHCPFHKDKNPSFVANNSKGTWLYKCFSCGSAGSLIDLHAEATGQVAKSKENIWSAAESVGITPTEDNTCSAKEKRAYAKRKQDEREAQLRRQARDKMQGDITEKIRQTIESKLRPHIVDTWRLDFLDESPIRIDNPNDARRDFVQFLFKEEDVLWLGDVYDSGKPENAANFKTCKQWINSGNLPPRIAAGTFKAGSISRGGDNVLTKPFIVLECDAMIGYKAKTAEDKERNKNLCAALIAYCRIVLGLTLRAVIDTGGKSLHAWFDAPPGVDLKALEALGEGMGVDMDVFKQCSSSPLRLPNCRYKKTKQAARLLYLSPVCL